MTRGGAGHSIPLPMSLPDDLLLGVQTPGRYINHEWNVRPKPDDQVRLRLALCYPDVYQVGMDHLGLLILYHVANQVEGVAAERCFAPWPDAAEAMRRRGLPLATLESGTPLAQCDVIGFTLQYELTYPTMLAMLDMGGVAVRSAERQGPEPVVIAGGPGATNPEPLAPFVDLFCLGDGEELLAELLGRLMELTERLGPRRQWDRARREEALAELARIDGVYWPAAYRAEAHGPHLIPRPVRADVPERVRLRMILDLDRAPFPTAPPVPWVQTTHDRGQIEIARGCVRGCRFCHAGMVYRPVRERSVETLVQQARQLINSTGYDELSLVSLNCPDYRRIDELIAALQAELAGRGVSIGLPSLRVDTVSVALAERVARVRKGGMTFAPEAGTQRLRDVINKNVTEGDLLRAAEAAFAAGWLTVKLYFMMGLPTETDEDVEAIGELVEKVAAVGRRTLGPKRRRLRVNVSVATFNPKPHTPFQWCGQADRETLRRRQELLRQRVRDRAVHVSFHDIGQSQVEAAVARGDRRVAEAIEAAWRDGAYLDPWNEFFDLDRWRRAFEQAGLELEKWAAREIDLDAPLPWDVVDVGVDKDFLRREYTRAMDGVPTPDCRQTGCKGCGIQRLVEGCRGVVGGED